MEHGHNAVAVINVAYRPIAHFKLGQCGELGKPRHSIGLCVVFCNSGIAVSLFAVLGTYVTCALRIIVRKS